MTWVIGATSIFGYSVIVSDVQVTCTRSGRCADILQKAYPVGRNIAAGFAGDVPTGLSLLHYLAEILNPPDMKENEIWDPRWVAENWGSVAKKLFADMSQRHRVGETHILLAGTRDVPGKEVTQLGGTVGCISVLKSPDFVPEVHEGGRMIASIGCGSNCESCRDDLDHIINDPDFVYLQGEVRQPGGHGRRIAGTVEVMVRRNPLTGVSQHFHTTLVGAGVIEQYRSPAMPKVATNWPDLQTLLLDDMDSASLIAPIT